MNNCERASDMLIEYINRKLSFSENNEIILHLASCPKCMNEVSKLILIKNIQKKKMVNVPDDILNSAFDKIPDEKSTLDDILESGSYHMAYDLISYTISVVQQTMQLAKQAISI